MNNPEIPQPLDRVRDLPVKIRALAAGLHALRNYVTTPAMMEATEEELRIVDIKTTLFDIYSRNTEEFEALFIEHSRDLDRWRKELMNDVTPLTSHMGPLHPMPPGAPHLAAASAKTFQAPAWTMTEEELAAQSEKELNSVLAGTTI